MADDGHCLRNKPSTPTHDNCGSYVKLKIVHNKTGCYSLYVPYIFQMHYMYRFIIQNMGLHICSFSFMVKQIKET